MTNITLSVDTSTHKRMKQYSEIKWSEFVRKAINKRLAELEQIDKQTNKESVYTMLASQDVLAKEWDNKEDERWNNV